MAAGAGGSAAAAARHRANGKAWLQVENVRGAALPAAPALLQLPVPLFQAMHLFSIHCVEVSI